MLLAVTSPTRRPTPTRTLPQRSTRGQVRPQQESYPRSLKRKPVVKLLASNAASDVSHVKVKPDTARKCVRRDIASQTKPKCDAFLLENKDYFIPLLPANNYVAKLAESSDGLQLLTVPHKPIQTQPQGIKATMKSYQLEGLSFLVHMYNNGMSAILGDEMGLGKTLQTLSLFQYLEETHPSLGEPRPFLVVCPMSVLSSWVAEARKWAPKLRVLRYHGPRTERDRLKLLAVGKIDQYGNTLAGQSKKRKEKRESRGVPVVDLDDDDERSGTFDLVITTYETFVAEKGWFSKVFVWRYCVLDEGHKIKNDESKVAHALQSLRAEHRLLLTGTPLQNNLREMWSLLHWLYPDVFTEKTSGMFKDAFDLSRGKVSTKFMDDARHLLELVMLRRMKNSPSVNLGLPPKEEVLLYVPLTPIQREWYVRLLTKAGNSCLEAIFKDTRSKEQQALVEDHEEDRDLAVQEQAVDKQDDWAESREIMRQAIESEQSDDKSSHAWKRLMNLVLQLRKCCVHPYALKAAAPNPYYLGDHVTKASGKFIVLEKLVNELVLKQGKRILIFSGLMEVLNCCEDLLALKGANTSGGSFKYLRLDGSTERARRNLAIRLFNQPGSDYKVMLISTRAGGLGINCQAASEIVFMDEDWNPQITLQAEARSHRIGQTQKVTVYKLCTQGTVEEQMMGRIRKKLYLSTKIIESMRNIHSMEGKSSKKRKSTRTGTEDDTPHLGKSELMSLVRRGASTLTHPEVDVNEMLEWDWETALENCKDRALDPRVADSSADSTAVDEQAWLAKMERVETEVFKGARYQRNLNDTEAAAEILNRQDRRVGKSTTVMVDGFAINKESMSCADWEAVPTMAGKDPRLAEPKREKPPPINHQDRCQVCYDGGEVAFCSSCPRVYHVNCLDPDFRARAKSKVSFYCPQHQCFDCEKKTVDAGGMIYRCRWCEKGFCEDCLDWDSTRLVGETLKEYELLDYSARSQAWYIECPSCIQSYTHDDGFRQLIDESRAEVEALYEQALPAAQNKDKSRNIHVTPLPHGHPDLDAVSMTEATTVEVSGVSTPKIEDEGPPVKKRNSGKVRSSIKDPFAAFLASGDFDVKAGAEWR